MMSLQQGIEEIEGQEADDEKQKGEHRDYSNRRKVSPCLLLIFRMDTTHGIIPEGRVAGRVQIDRVFQRLPSPA